MNRIEVLNPVTGETVGSVEVATESYICAAAGRAREAQMRWEHTKFADRAAIFRRFHDMVIDRSDVILDTIQSETAKTRRDALAEIVTIAGTVRYYLAHAEEQIGDAAA